jgi:hypothetical protein
MATPADLYVNGIKKKLRNYFATWLPNQVLKLGDVGVLDGNFFVRLSSLEDFGISFGVRDDPDPSPIDYVSEESVEVTFKAAGESNSSLPSIPEAKAGVGVEFSSKGAFVVKAEESYEPSIENILDIQRAILKAFQEGRWDRSWAVIVKLVKTPTATVLVSNSSASKLELAVEGDISSGAIDLGSGSISFGVKTQRGDVLKIIGAKNISPFFQLAKIKRRFLGPPDVVLTGHNVDVLRSRGLSDASSLRINSARDLNEHPELLESYYLDLIKDSDLSDATDQNLYITDQLEEEIRRWTASKAEKRLLNG